MNPLEIIQAVFGEEYEFGEKELSTLYEVVKLATRNRLEWQPIETAPRDMTEILLWDKEFEACAVGYFFEPLAQWVNFPGCTEEVSPTHWMPLPEPPEEE